MLNPYIMGRTKYRVVAPVVVAVSVANHDTYVYRGALLPLNTRPTQIESLLASGMVEKVEASA